MSSFFGTSMTILLVISSLYNGTLNQVYNFKVFLITRILTLMEKQDIFRNECLKIFNNYKEDLRLTEYLNGLLCRRTLLIIIIN